MVLEQIEKTGSTTSSISNKNDYKKYGWKNIAVKIKENDLVLLNRQLDRLGYETLGDLVKDLLLGKITYLTEERQIEAMKINMQGSGQNTVQLGGHYDFYKNIDIDDLLKEFMKRYHTYLVSYPHSQFLIQQTYALLPLFCTYKLLFSLWKGYP
jgi:hypothetical protein